MAPADTASDRVFMEDANGVTRLVAAPGDVVPATAPPLGVVTTPDPATATVEPFDGYDGLSAAEIVDRLAGLSAEELAAVQAYEQAHRARGTITRYGRRSRVVTSAKKDAAAVEVPAESTSGGYDAMNVPDLQAEADRRGLEVQGTGADGNVVKADLVGALQADDATTEA